MKDENLVIMRPDKLCVHGGAKMSINVTVVSSALIAGAILLVTSCARKSSVAECEYPRGTLAYWKLDEGEGNTARDSVNGNDGINYGATWVPGQVGTALSFDGTDDRVQIPSQVISGTTMTLSLWVKQMTIDSV